MTGIPGCVTFALASVPDERGTFLKLFQRSVYDAVGGDGDIAEIFVSRSRRGVVRGLHFQVPPHAHAKTVVCLEGRALDVVVELRAGSPAYHHCETFVLDAGEARAIHVPAGCAHGFQALADDTVMLYAVSTEHAPAHDAGVRFDTVGVEWPVADPIVSARDRAFPALSEFESPFRYPS